MKTTEHDSDDALARLLRLAGPRPAPEQAMRDEVYANVRSAWLARHRRVRRLRIAGLAAAVVAAIAIAVLLRMPEPVPALATVAVADRVIGDVSISVATLADDSAARDLLQPGVPIAQHRTIRSAGNALAGLKLANGASLRVAPGTSLRLESASEIALEHGRIYLDTAGAPPAAQFAIRTRAGIVRDIGTQFEVLSNAARLRVRVRDGEIELASGAQLVHAHRGEELVVTAGEEVRRQQFAPTDSGWDWTRELAPPFETDQARVADLLAWVGRETGREVVYADATVRNAAAATRISGSIAGLAPEQTMTIALAATLLQARIDGERIVVARAGD